MKMKRFFATLSCAALAVALLPSCDKKSPEAPELSFEIDLSNLQPTGVDLKVVPTLDDATYYYDVLSEEAMEFVLEAGLQTYFDGEVEGRMEAYSLTREEVLAKLLSKGEVSYSFTKLVSLSDYHAVAFGVSAEGEVTTELFHEDFSTPAVSPSDNVLDISVSNIEADGADYSVKASNQNDPYVVDIWSKSLVDELGDRGTMDYFIEYNSFMLPMLTCTGDFTLQNEQVCQPGRDYYVIAFGCSDGEPTTKLYKKEFKTVGGDPAKCSFKFTYPEQTPERVKIRVTPSDKKVVYIWNVADIPTFNTLKDNKGSEQAAFEALLEDNISTEMENQGIKRQQAVESLGRWSGYTTSDAEGYDEENIYGLTAGAGYIAWAVAVDADGKPEGAFYSDQFTTPKE